MAGQSCFTWEPAAKNQSGNFILVKPCKAPLPTAERRQDRHRGQTLPQQEEHEKVDKTLFENLFIGWDVLCLNKELVEYMIWSQAFLGGGANLDFNFAKAQLKSSWSNSPFFLGRKQELSLMILHAIRVDIHDDFWKLVWFHQIGL